MIDDDSIFFATRLQKMIYFRAASRPATSWCRYAMRDCCARTVESLVSQLIATHIATLRAMCFPTLRVTDQPLAMPAGSQKDGQVIHAYRITVRS
jgi:hypothetical protein